MTIDNEKDETPIPRGGGDISGKSATPVPRGGGDISGKSATEEVPKGGGDISGKTVAGDPNESSSEGDERSREIRKIPPPPVE
jgi:hypothetical protein